MTFKRPNESTAKKWNRADTTRNSFDAYEATRVRKREALRKVDPEAAATMDAAEKALAAPWKTD